MLAHDPTAINDGLPAPRFAPRLHVIRTRSISSPVTCRHCDDAPCLKACPSGAIYMSADTVQVEQSRCLGCKTCVVACPFGVMEVITQPVVRNFSGVRVADGVKAEAHKCDLCVNRDQGPACVQVCPTAALHVMDDDMMADLQVQRRQRTALGSGLTGAAG